MNKQKYEWKSGVDPYSKSGTLHCWVNVKGKPGTIGISCMSVCKQAATKAPFGELQGKDAALKVCKRCSAAFAKAAEEIAQAQPA